MSTRQKKAFIGVAVVLALMLTLGAGSAWAGTGTVTVQLYASDGVTGSSGAAVSYYKGGKQLLGYTDGTGSFSAYISNVYTTTIYLDPISGGTRIWLLVDPATNPTLAAQMVAVTIELKTCAGASLMGEAFYYRSGWRSLGNTPVTVDLLPYTGLGPGQGNYDFHVKYGGRTSATIRQDISVNPAVLFNTTKVTLNNAGNVYYYNGGWQLFPNGLEMVGGTFNGSTKFADFKFGGRGGSYPTVTLAIDGCEITKTVLFVRLKDSKGIGVPEGKAYLGVGGWPYMGETDANGQLVYIHNGILSNMRVRLTAPNSGGTQTSPLQDVAVNLYFNFQTSEIMIKLLNSAGVLTDGGQVTINDGGWPVIGTTGDDGQGVVKHEHFLPYTRTFRMSYNYGTEEKSQDIGTNPVVVFQTGLVKLWFSGTIQHGVGGWPGFVNPTEMLPVEHRFGFSGPGYSRNELKFTPTAGAVLEKTVAYVRVRNSSGGGVSGINGNWWDYGGSQTAFGPTNDDGTLLIPMDGKHAKTAVQVFYLGAGSDYSFPNPATVNSFYPFQLVNVTVRLVDNTGAVIGSATPTIRSHYYGASEFEFGIMSGGTVDRDLLPTNGNVYYFDIKNYSFNGSQGGVSKKITAATTVEIQTGRVLDGGFGCDVYWQYGGSQQAFSDGIQLLPGNFYFKDNGSVTTKNFTVKAGQTLYLNDGSYTTPKITEHGEQGIATPELPTTFELLQNYPNPFNPSTIIRVALPVDATVSLTVYNTLGQKVAELMNGTVRMGYHDVRFDATNLGSGLYIYRMVAKGNDGRDFGETRKMMLLK